MASKGCGQAGCTELAPAPLAVRSGWQSGEQECQQDFRHRCARYHRLDNRAGVSDVHEWGRSTTIGGGVEYRMSRRIGLRPDFRHVDNQMSHLLIGVPISQTDGLGSPPSRLGRRDGAGPTPLHRQNPHISPVRRAAPIRHSVPRRSHRRRRDKKTG